MTTKLENFLSRLSAFQWFRITLVDMTSYEMADEVWRNLASRRLLTSYKVDVHDVLKSKAEIRICRWISTRQVILVR